MVPLLVLVGSWFLLRLTGRLGIRPLDTWLASGRAALAVMFLFTGSTHFTSMRHDYLAMVPDILPRHMGLIYMTGFLEIAGGLGLLIPQTRRLAGIGLLALLLAMFPANVYAALRAIPFRGEPPMSLWLRAPIQIAFLVSIWWTSVRQAGGGEGDTAAGE